MANRESAKFMLRLPDGLRDRISAAANEAGRSMNAEIVETLLEKYPAFLPPLTLDNLDSFITYIGHATGPDDRMMRVAESNDHLATYGMKFRVLPTEGGHHDLILEMFKGQAGWVMSRTTLPDQPQT